MKLIFTTGKKIAVISSVAMLLFVTVVLSLIFCEEISNTHDFEESLWKNDFDNDSVAYGGGEPGGPGPPQ